MKATAAVAVTGAATPDHSNHILSCPALVSLLTPSQVLQRLLLSHYKISKGQAAMIPTPHTTLMGSGQPGKRLLK